MKIFELLKNPLIKFVGIGLIIYFGLFANKQSPNSLGNRISSEKIKQTFDEAQEKGKFIATNAIAAKEFQERQIAESKNYAKNNSIEIEDLESGEADKAAIICGDEAEISYGIYVESGKQVKFVEKELLIIGSKKNQLIEPNIIGMKLGATRNIKVSRYLSIDDVELAKLIKFYDSDLKIQVTLLSSRPSQTPNIVCQ